MNKSINTDNSKYQAFLAAIEKRKAEIAANKAEKPNHEAVKPNNEAFTKLIERIKAAKEAAKETAE